MSKPQRPELLARGTAGLITFALIAYALLAGFWISHPVAWAAAAVFQIIWLFALAGWRHNFLERAMRDEDNDRRRIKREYDREDLFHDRDDRIAGALYEGYLKYGVRIFCVFVGLLLGIVVIFWLRDLGPHSNAATQSPVPIAGFAGFVAVLCILGGSFMNGVSREAGCRWMRPIAQMSFLAAFFNFLLAAAMLAEMQEKLGWSKAAGILALAILALIAIELLVSPLLDFYRPRIPGEAVTPLYESRPLSFVTQPGSIAENIAAALDYQFGVKVSDTWVYSIVVRGCVPLVALSLAILYVLGCFVGVGAHEIGIRETYSLGGTSKRELVESGLHVKLPWPFQVIRRVPAHQVQTIDVGLEKKAKANEGMPEDEDPYLDTTQGRVITWDKRHEALEGYFLLASDEEEVGEDSRLVPVTALQVHIPIHFRVGKTEADVLAYAYNYDDPRVPLAGVCQRELVRFFASSSFNDVVGRGRTVTATKLTRRISEAVAAVKPPLGVEITYVALTDLHPPVETGESFQQVVGAQEELLAKVLRAEGDARAWQNEAKGLSDSVAADAEAYRQERKLIPEARSLRFAQQCAAYAKAPSIYTRRLMMETLAERDVRCVFIATRAKQILEVNLEEDPEIDLTRDLKLK